MDLNNRKMINHPPSPEDRGWFSMHSPSVENSMDSHIVSLQPLNARSSLPQFQCHWHCRSSMPICAHACFARQEVRQFSKPCHTIKPQQWALTSKIYLISLTSCIKWRWFRKSGYRLLIIIYHDFLSTLAHILDTWALIFSSCALFTVYPSPLHVITTRAQEGGPKEHRAKQKWPRETHCYTCTRALHSFRPFVAFIKLQNKNNNSRNPLQNNKILIIYQSTVKWIREKYYYRILILKTKAGLHNIHHSLPNENFRGVSGPREAYGSEKRMLKALLAGFSKTNALAQTVAGLVWPWHQNCLMPHTSIYLWIFFTPTSVLHQ